MPKKTITFTVKPTGTIKGYWIAVGEDDVKLTNGVGSIDLTVGERYILLWHMVGNGGAGIGISGKDSRGNEVATVKESLIPQGESSAGGARRFEVGAAK